MNNQRKARKNNYWMLKSNLENKRRMDFIRLERIKKGKDKSIRSYDRILTAILRHDKYIQDVVNADFKEDTKDFLNDNRGQMEWSSMMMLFRFVIISLIVVVFFAGLIYVMGLLNGAFIQVGVTNEANAGQPGYVNLSRAAEVTWGQANSSIQGLRLVAITLIFSEILLIFIINSFKKVHPMMFIAWVFIVMLAVFLAAAVSNSYETLLQSGIYGGLLQSFTGSNFLLINLPLITLFVGLIGGIFMFINIVRVGNEEV